ncbi:hypothetical protein TWF569_004539 [Orbilia oligospora]|uniref:Extracellular membrane protein CFEM domain-containing protein n=1 Tax=Orbilia oligospora TaxID=2813651 RepID=A0A7C8JEX4_ORBOL|nr:hypothetical protein TWF102_006077 [Orbilia oligospora]KAF3098566.1 hypothetical protein TWF103_009002 [Orbilia oligospora]KAF3115175.1 hypothetical protein TWF706_007286 [Orbilia oligospora]KAF3144284.1 hypothetical protein TWF594_004816 [Orbilia oligospora]KAF3150663.1 hypothetical protein TWF569_004539 [Orbilia oligospora]
MTHHRPSKPHKLLLSPLFILLLPTLTHAQISSYFPPYLKSCIDRCQPLWSANYDCTLSGQSSLDCLCQSSWVEQFYEGSTCTCTSDFESQEFRNWFQGTGGCNVYVEARIRSSETSVPTSTVESSSSSSTEEETTTTSESTSRRTTSSVESTTTSDSESTTTGDSTFTTLPSTTDTGTRGSEQTGPATSTPTLTGSEQDSSSSFITDQNKRWVIPTITIGGLIVVGAGIFAFLFFCCGFCRRSGRGRYSKAHNPSLGGSALAVGEASAAAGVLGKRKKKRMWLSTIPFFGVSKSNRSDGSGDTLVGDPYDSQNPYQSRNSMVDTGYYGAGAGLMGLSGSAGGPGYVPYQHGAPLPPIDEVQSIAESTVTRDRGFVHARSPLADEDEPFQFGYAEQQGVSTYSPVGNGGRESMILPPMPVHQGFGEGLIGTALTTSAAATAAENRSRRENGDMSSFSNRYEDLASRRMDRRMFDPFGNPMPMPMEGGAGMVIPRKEIRSTPTTPVGEQVRSMTVSPPASTVSIASSSGFGGGGGPLAGRGGSGGFSGFPRAPAPAGSGLFTQQPGRRPGDYYEDYR